MKLYLIITIISTTFFFGTGTSNSQNIDYREPEIIKKKIIVQEKIPYREAEYESTIKITGIPFDISENNYLKTPEDFIEYILDLGISNNIDAIINLSDKSYEKEIISQASLFKQTPEEYFKKNNQLVLDGELYLLISKRIDYENYVFFKTSIYTKDGQLFLKELLGDKKQGNLIIKEIDGKWVNTTWNNKLPKIFK